MAAASVGAVTFDPASKLWVPAAQAIAPVSLSGQSVSSAIADQLELNDLAARVARFLAERLQQHPSLALREVMYRHAGHVRLADALDAEAGYFVPHPTRLLHTAGVMGPGANAADFCQGSAYALARDLPAIDMFAPLGVELRAGVPFADANVGVGMDPETGLCVRALRFEREWRGTVKLQTAFEVAGGQWKTRLLPEPAPRRKEPTLAAYAHVALLHILTDKET